VTELNPEIIADLWTKADDVFAYLKDLRHSWPLIQHIDKKKRSTIESLKPYADQFKAFKDVIILGTGGSSLGGQALTALAPSASPSLHFVDNIDSFTFQEVLQNLSPVTTGVISISKSGNTAETLMQTLTLLQNWPLFNPSSQALIVTENKDSAMRELAKAYSIPCLDHPDDVGGRFAVFTVVGLLPGMIVGLDVDAFCDGAHEAFQNAEDGTAQTCAPLVGSLMQIAFQKQGVSQSVLIAYCDRLEKTCEWFAQLWGESLGKKDIDGNPCGTTPVKALGAVDQHSQLQLYLDGPRDKFFTFLTIEDQTTLPAVAPSFELKHPATVPLLGRTMGALMLAEQQATMDTMRKHNCPLRQTQMQRLNEENLGSLMMHFMLETLLTAKFLDINPFDQPAVEEGKILALEYLQKRN
jgi:glucose-6-phosphate isomerase